MKSRSLLFLFAFLPVLPGLAAAAEKFELDPSHAQIEVSCEHFSVTNLGGWFTEVAGTLMYDKDDLSLSTVEMTIKTASFAATNAQRQGAVLSNIFLDAENHPEITFVSKKMEKAKDGAVVTGDLTLKGVSKEVSFPVVVRGPVEDPFGLPRIGVEGSVTVNRRDFGITFDRKMKNGAPFVGDEATIQLAAEFIQKPQ